MVDLRLPPMTAVILSLGLLLSGAFGFFAGARPHLLARLLFPGRSTQATPGDFIEYLYPLAAAFFAGFVFSTLVPHALSHSLGTLLAFGGGVACMAGLSRFVFKADPCCEVGHEHGGLSLLSLAALSLCSVNDGFLIGMVQPAWYSGLNAGMLLHKVTSSFAVAQVMARGRHRGFALAALGAAYVLISPAALWAARLPALAGARENEIAPAFGAGLLAYVTLSSLVPHAGGILRRRPRLAYGFAAALLVSVSLGLWHQALHGAEPKQASAENRP
jgi:hypothetical protein